MSKQNQLQEDNAPKICVSKLKINRPQISFNFFKKNQFWSVDALERGWGVGEKHPKDTLPEEINL